MGKLNEMQSRVNAWIEKVGLESITHFFVAAWLVAECKVYGFGAGCIGFVAVCVLAFVKEKFLDKYFTSTDFWWSALGGFVSLALMAVKDAIG